MLATHCKYKWQTLNGANLKKVVFALLVFFLGGSAIAAPFKDMPGCIPLEQERQAAADLIYKDKILVPDEARALKASGEIKDLSLLDPDGTSILWKEEVTVDGKKSKKFRITSNSRSMVSWENQIGGSQIDDLKKLDLTLSDSQVEFISSSREAVGRISFLAKQTNTSGALKTYQVNLDNKGHNVLIRKVLLRKIGYNIPPIESIRRIRVKFPSESAKRSFVKDILEYTNEESKRWAIEDADTSSEYLTLQDVIVFEGPDDKFYNLARGDMADASTIQGRRLLNALLVPFFLTDSPQSVNLFSWVGSQIFNQQLCMPYADPEAFSTLNIDDARWIMRRILNLSRNDWNDAVRATRAPDEVQAILVEKLISRRNYLRKYLNMENESVELSFNADISMGSRLQKGKLIGEEWPGYARHWAGVDPDSPWNLEEMFGFAKSLAIGNAISNTIYELNTRYMPRTDVGFAVFDHQLDASAQAFADFISTHEIQKKSLGFWSTKFFDTNIIAGRDVVAGSYLGTENIVQVADTIGFASDYGRFYLGENLPFANGFASGSVKLFLVKTWTHLKPLASIKAGLKEPFRNIMVPYLKAQATSPLDKIVDLKSKKDILSSEELDKQIKAQLDEFNKMFGTGESLIVSSSIGPDLQLTVGKGLHHDAQVYATLEDKLTAISRMHIFRKDEKTVQVYIDPALVNALDFSLGLRLKVPIVEIGFGRQDGLATTNFFEFSLDTDKPDFFDQVAAVSAAMNGVSKKVLSNYQKPWTIDFNFSDKSRRGKLLSGRYLHSDTSNQLKITHPTDYVKEYIRRTKGERTGQDYQAVLIDVTNALINEKLKVANKVNTPSSGNPGDTVMGKSVTRQVVVESELNPTSVKWDTMFAGVNYRWKGWQMKKADAEDVMRELQRTFGKELFRIVELHETEKVQFYSVQVEIDLYEKAFGHIYNLKEGFIRQIFDQHGKMIQVSESSSPLDNGNQWANSVINDLRDLRKCHQQGDRKGVVDHLTDILEVVESQLDFQGFKMFVGGVDNLFARGTLTGFRVNAENGKQDIQSISLGQIGSYKPRGPLQFVQDNMHISGGEFFISWLLNPL